MTISKTEHDMLIARRSELRIQLGKFYREGDTSHPNIHEKHLISELDDINLKLMKSKVEQPAVAQSIWK